jgi:hypothetical protein
MEAEPVQDPLEVVPDGVCAQLQPLGDGCVGQSFRRKQRDLGWDRCYAMEQSLRID